MLFIFFNAVLMILNILMLILAVYCVLRQDSSTKVGYYFMAVLFMLNIVAQGVNLCRF